MMVFELQNNKAIPVWVKVWKALIMEAVPNRNSNVCFKTCDVYFTKNKQT